jgi:hypothetical protein
LRVSFFLGAAEPAGAGVAGLLVDVGFVFLVSFVIQKI